MEPGENEVWTLAEQREGKLKPISYELLAWGKSLADKLNVPLASLVIGNGISQDALESLIHGGADRVYSIQHPLLTHFICESYARVLQHLIQEHHPAVLLGGATTTGRTLLPYVAIKVHTGLTADCTGLDIEPGTGNLLQTRPAIGGNILATIKTPNHRPQMATIRPRSKQPLCPDPSRAGVIESIIVQEEWLDNRVQFLGRDPLGEEGDGLEGSDIVVSGGKGLRKGENFSLIRGLAQELRAAVGASREAVDRGWISYPHQVGLSGKTIAPKLYIAIGISGSIQHLAGIKSSEQIAAVNLDPNAPIFQVADFGIVGDLFQVVPRIRDRIRKYRLEKQKEDPAYGCT